MTDIERPTGRPCATCSSPHRAHAEEMLAEGLSLSAISGQTGISRSSLRQHARAHLEPEVAERVARVLTHRPSTIALRINAIAQRARDAAEAAEEAGDAEASTRASNAELRALQTLAAVGVTSESLLENLDYLESVVVAFVELSRDRPKLQAAVAETFERRNRADLAQQWQAEFVTNTTNTKEIAR